MVRQMMRWRTISLAGVGLISICLLAGGCDDKPDHATVASAPTKPQTKPAADQPAGPTTQELLEAPRQRLTLAPLPLTVMAPPGWSVQQMPGSTVVFLQGPLLTGEDVHIQLSRKETRWTQAGGKGVSMDERIDLLKEGALKEQHDHPDRVKHVSVRKLGTAKIFDKQSVSPPSSMLHLDEKGNPITLAPLYHWTITVFVPDGDKFNAYELNFLDLNTDEYKTSRDFLMGIMQTLQLQGAPASQP